MHKRSLRLALILWAGLTALPAQANAAVASNELVYIGTWGKEAPPPSGALDAKPVPANGPAGIYAARLDEKTGHLTPLGLQIPLERADSLVTDPHRSTLYSVAASAQGGRAPSDVYGFRIDPASGKLHLLDKVSSGGQDATTMALDGRSSTLFVGNHASGDVVSIPIRQDGSLGPVASLQKDYGKGPTPRQQGPQVHGVAVDPWGRHVLTADFGADRVFVYRFDGRTRKLTPAQPPFVSLPGGSAPRHVVFSPNGRFAFVITELSGIVQSYRWDGKGGQLHLVQTVSPTPDSQEEDKGGADIAVSNDGRFLYFSIRDHVNSLFVYAIDPKTGSLRRIQRISAEGQRPWSFGIDPTGRWLLVTNMGSQSVAVFKVDPATGLLTATDETMAVPNPSAVAFSPGE